MNNEDEILIKATLSGDNKAFERLINRYQKQVASIIYFNIGDKGYLEDFVQEVFIRVYKSLNKFKHDKSFYSWIYQITKNLCIDEIRRRKIRKIVSLDFITENSIDNLLLSAEQDKPSDALIEEEKKQFVRAALQKLKYEHREVLLLREYQDFSYSQIAEHLNISIEAVKLRIFRARIELKNILNKYFKELR